MSVRQIARLVAFLLVIAFIAWAIYLLVVGLPHTQIPEGQPDEGLPPGATTVYRPYSGAIYSLAALLLIGIGLFKDEWLPLAWLGVTLHFIFGAFLVWSMGILYVAVAGALTAPLGILYWRITQQKKWLAIAWTGVGIVLLVGVLLAGTSTGFYVLAASILLGLVTAALQWRARQYIV